MESRKRQEQEFHDRLRSGVMTQRWASVDDDAEALWSNMKYYSVERGSLGLVRGWLRAQCPGRRVLDYCCGNGEDAIFAAEHGATAVGIDISPVSIENCRSRTASLQGPGTATFCVMDAENLAFPDATFDLVVVYGVLHHLDLERALLELSRVLKPDGRIVCTEALRHNPIIQLYRRLTPKLRTPWEIDHILRRKDFIDMRRHFGAIDISFHHLAVLMAVPFRSSRIFGLVLRTLEAVDRMILRLPVIRWLAWQAVFFLGKPTKRMRTRRAPIVAPEARD